jgi:hypothetical protein
MVEKKEILQAHVGETQQSDRKRKANSQILHHRANQDQRSPHR